MTNDTIAVVNVCQISNSVLFWLKNIINKKIRAVCLWCKSKGTNQHVIIHKGCRILALYGNLNYS